MPYSIASAGCYSAAQWIKYTIEHAMTNLSLRRRKRLAGMVAAQAPAAMSNASGKLQVTDVRLFTLREPVSRRSYSVVEVRTTGGLVGYGEGPPAAATSCSAPR